jgi:hypothetical protein
MSSKNLIKLIPVALFVVAGIISLYIAKKDFEIKESIEKRKKAEEVLSKIPFSYRSTVHILPDSIPFIIYGFDFDYMNVIGSYRNKEGIYINNQKFSFLQVAECPWDSAGFAKKRLNDIYSIPDSINPSYRKDAKN